MRINSRKQRCPALSYPMSFQLYKVEMPLIEILIPNLDYTRGITPKRGTSGGNHLCAACTSITALKENFTKEFDSLIVILNLHHGLLRYHGRLHRSCVTGSIQGWSRSHLT